jgi:hypothetical protein
MVANMKNNLSIVPLVAFCLSKEVHNKMFNRKVPADKNRNQFHFGYQGLLMVLCKCCFWWFFAASHLMMWQISLLEQYC